MSRIHAVAASFAFVALLGLTACEPESSNPNPNTCGPANCGGCCTPAGVCAAGADPNACGVGGAACQSCGGLQCVTGVCKNPGPTCGPNNCGGCCSGDTCNSGQDKTACGSAGGACTLCGGDESCVAGICGKVCDATTCPTGCCENGVCIGASQQSVQRCGVGGQACKICGNGEQCTNQACTATACNATTCPTGCCDATGNCKTGQSDSACGTGGGTCATCDSSKEKCTGGTCQAVTTTCNATTCPTGCCDDKGQCVPGNAVDNCGTGGAACSQCGSNLQCVGQKCACTTTSCPGCCDGDTCKAGSDVNFCGTGGAACTKCTGTDKCLAGNCQTDCSFLTCKGCCKGTSCVEPTNVSNCGAYGSACTTCGATDTCETGTCNDASKCNSSNCPTGCCKNGVCQVGTFDDACGENGKVCELCREHVYCGKDPYYGTQECLATNSSTWDVIVSKVTLNPNPASPWDTFLEKPEPDVYVEVTVGSKTGKTSQKNNQFTPVFDDYVLTATAAELATKITFEVRDSDTFGSDLIGKCVDVIYPSELKSGYVYIPGCGGDPSNTDVLSIEFKFVVKGK